MNLDEPIGFQDLHFSKNIDIAPSGECIFIS